MLHKELLQFELRSTVNQMNSLNVELKNGIEGNYERGLKDGMLMTLKRQADMLNDYIRYMEEDENESRTIR